ncbi:hypothetical protein ABG067_004980 [Albugo candida]
MSAQEPSICRTESSFYAELDILQFHSRRIGRGIDEYYTHCHGNMKLLAFELCTLHLFSKSQQSYTTDIFKTQVIFDLEDFKNSVIALHGSYTGSKTWSITYSENLGGTITQKELVIDGISESGRDASTTNQGCCGMEFFSNGKKIQDLKNKVAFNH